MVKISEKVNNPECWASKIICRYEDAPTGKRYLHDGDDKIMVAEVKRTRARITALEAQLSNAYRVKAECNDEANAQRRRAKALEAQLAERVGVKLMEWEGIGARSSIGDLYEVTDLGGSVWQVRKNGTAFPGWSSSRSEGRAAAQADFDRRILSALAVPSTSMLGSLLAIIHRDGGHYEAEHGTKKAFNDAKEIVSRLHNTPPAPKAELWTGEGDGFKSFTLSAKVAERWRKGSLKVTPYAALSGDAS